jgi:hypothetical protein
MRTAVYGRGAYRSVIVTGESLHRRGVRVRRRCADVLDDCPYTETPVDVLASSGPGVDPHRCFAGVTDGSGPLPADPSVAVVVAVAAKQSQSRQSGRGRDRGAVAPGY